MAVHPLFQIITNAHFPSRPYRLYDDAQWPELPGARVETDETGRASIVHDPAERQAERERLHDPLFPYRR